MRTLLETPVLLMSGIWGRISGTAVIRSAVIPIFLFCFVLSKWDLRTVDLLPRQTSAPQQYYETCHRIANTAVTMKTRLVLIIIIITMAQQPYMGPGPLFSRLLSRAHSWQLVTGQLAALLFYRSWCVLSHLAGSQETWGEKWRQFSLRNIFIHARKVLLHAVNLRHGTDGFTSPQKEVVLRIFITLKNPSTSVGIEPANLGSSGEHANH
jgi:hypothetical protein